MSQTEKAPIKTQASALLLLGVSLTAILAPPAHAYIDPGTGSIIIQGLIAALVGGLFAIKMGWVRFKGLFRKDPKDPTPPL